MTTMIRSCSTSAIMSGQACIILRLRLGPAECIYEIEKMTMPSRRSQTMRLSGRPTITAAMRYAAGRLTSAETAKRLALSHAFIFPDLMQGLVAGEKGNLMLDALNDRQNFENEQKDEKEGNHHDGVNVAFDA